MKTLQGHVFGAATAARVLQGAINSEGSGRWLSKEKKFHGLLDPMTRKQKDKTMECETEEEKESH